MEKNEENYEEEEKVPLLINLPVDKCMNCGLLGVVETIPLGTFCFACIGWAKKAKGMLLCPVCGMKVSIGAIERHQYQCANRYASKRKQVFK